MNVNPLYSTVQYSTVHYITLHYITLHYITLHYITSQYVPFIGRVRGPYGKLFTEFFPSFYGPSAKCAGHENKKG